MVSLSPERLKSTVETAPAIPTAELNRSILKEDLWLAISLLPICGCNNIHVALLCIFLSCGISSDIRADMFCSFQFADAFSCGIFHSNICATAYFS